MSVGGLHRPKTVGACATVSTHGSKHGIGWVLMLVGLYAVIRRAKLAIQLTAIRIRNIRITTNKLYRAY